MFERITLFILMVLIHSNPLTAEQKVEFTTYYPAPYGDFEQVRTNALEIYGPLSAPGPFVHPPSNIEHLSTVTMHKSLSILGDLSKPYSQIEPGQIRNTITIDAQKSEIMFGKRAPGSGIFFKNTEHAGLHTNQAEDFEELRLFNQGPIILKPWLQNKQGLVHIQGNLRIEGDLLMGGKFGGILNTIENPAQRIVSDARLKTDIQPITNALDIVQELQGVHYKWTKHPELPSKPGFLAQNIEQVLPELVHEDSKGQKSIETIHLTALLVEAIKSQQKQIKLLEQYIKNKNT